ncbi:MAG: lipopolysaccharide heptosyltransferase II, partial [Gammaproteobacteria bacterium]|nr:lipopolysaccharide heptosyltransferase II [Gammaproteobacteria bacterium]
MSDSKDNSHILVVGPAWIGDMVMAQSLFITLKQHFPDCEIDVLAPAWSKSLLARMPEVRSAVTLPLGHGEFGFGARRRLGHLLRGRYGWAIVTPRSWKSALVPFFAGIPQRTGYRGEWRYGLINDIRRLDKKVLRQTVQRYVTLGLERDAPMPPAEFPIPHLRVDPQNQQALLQKFALNRNAPIVALMPGAEYGPSKRWPVDRCGELAKRLLAAGKQVWVFGSVREQSLGEEITRIAGNKIANLCGSTRLEDVIDLMALAETAVTNDSGLMHIAAAVGIKVVALYGSSSPDYTPPLTDKAEIVDLYLDCSPCFQRECP